MGRANPDASFWQLSSEGSSVDHLIFSGGTVCINCIDYGSVNTADHHLLARRFAANVLPARLPMKRPRPQKSAPGGSKIEARGGQNGVLEEL